ncbi:MAG: DUF3021 domain-containing protein [Eubacteriales bacterium]
MNYKKEIIKRAAYGVPIGIAIGATFALVIAYIMKDQNGLPAPAEYRLSFYTVSYIVSMFIGAIFGASSVIWDVEKWSLRTQTILHFLITITSHLTCAVIANWIPFKLQAILIYGGIYFFLYVMIYIIIYSVQKKRIAQLNEALES